MGTLRAERKIEVDAPLERCYEIITDLERTPEWQETMISLKVLESDREGRPKLVEVASDAKVKQVTSQLSFRYHPPDRLTWEQVEGELKWMNGSWELTENPSGGTTAAYTIEADPGRMLSLLLRGPVEGKVKELLTKDATDGLKRRAEEGP